MKNKTMAVRSASICFVLGTVLCAATFCLSSAAQEKPGQTIFYTHGRIYTNDPVSPWAEAMAVADGKITCIGKMAHVLLDCGGSQQGAETISLEEHFVMPGFNDAHVHLGGAGADALAVQLRGIASPEEMQKRVAEAVAHHKEGEWITGGGMGSHALARQKVSQPPATRCRRAKKSGDPDAHFRSRGGGELAGAQESGDRQVHAESSWWRD